jgi:hypothetical protein
MNDPTINKQLNQFERPPPSRAFLLGLPSNGWSGYEVELIKVVPKTFNKPPTVFNRSQKLEVTRDISYPYIN